MICTNYRARGYRRGCEMNDKVFDVGQGNIFLNSGLLKKSIPRSTNLWPVNKHHIK